MIEERQRRANRKGVQPERNLGEFDRHRVLIDPVHASLQDETLDEVLVGQLLVRHGPAMRVGFSPDFRPDCGEPADQRRNIVGPGDRFMRVPDRGHDLLGEIINQRDEKMA